mgnify:CR=1 FL=1
MSQTTRITDLGLGLAASALALTGCSAESDAATEADIAREIANVQKLEGQMIDIFEGGR